MKPLDQLLNQIEERANKATEGPWEVGCGVRETGRRKMNSTLKVPQMALCVAGDQPTFDANGYPTDETEQTITDWPFENGYHSLLAYVANAWRYPDYFTADGNEYRISTGGWSGNESLIGALERNRVFWALCWVSSTRGGHYVFEVPVPSDPKEPKSDNAVGVSNPNPSDL